MLDQNMKMKGSNGKMSNGDSNKVPQDELPRSRRKPLIDSSA